MKKGVSIFYLIVGYLTFVYSLKDIPLEDIITNIVGLLFIYSGIYYVISDFNLLKIPFFNKRKGALFFTFVLPVIFLMTIILLFNW